jgi:hypothetical protein
VLAIDAIGFYKMVLYSRFIYFVFPNKIMKLQRKREQLVEEIKLYTNKYIGAVDERYIHDRVIDVEEEIEEEDVLLRKNNVRRRRATIIDEINKFYININLIQGENSI